MSAHRRLIWINKPGAHNYVLDLRIDLDQDLDLDQDDTLSQAGRNCLCGSQEVEY